jgi:hypothetical protein
VNLQSTHTNHRLVTFDVESRYPSTLTMLVLCRPVPRGGHFNKLNVKCSNLEPSIGCRHQAWL